MKHLLVAVLWVCIVAIYYCEPETILDLSPKQPKQAFGLLAVQLALVVTAIIVEGV